MAQKAAQITDDGELVADCDAAAAIVSAAPLADANINPTTGLATDYLNHFNEAIMLLEMVATCPDCLADFPRWQPMSYREHFQASHFKGRDLAIAAYDAADPAARECLDTLAEHHDHGDRNHPRHHDRRPVAGCRRRTGRPRRRLAQIAGRARRRRDQWQDRYRRDTTRRRRWSTV